ncbi:MAG: TolC family protein [Desulfobacterales bacterium]|nr:TolC family protein [Desulfobacterales bacterium]
MLFYKKMLLLAFILFFYTCAWSMESIEKEFENYKLTGVPLSLMDAVRLTLENDSNIDIQKEDSNYKQGTLQIASSEFDLKLSIDASGSFVQEELSPKEYKEQLAINERLRGIANGAHKVVQDIEKQLSVLNAGDIPVLNDSEEIPTINMGNSKAWGEIFNTIIAREEDQAKREELIKLRDEAIAQGKKDIAYAIEAQKKIEKEANEALAEEGRVPRSKEYTNTSLKLSLTQTLRNGVEISPQISLKESVADFRGKEQKEAQRPIYSSEMGFQIKIPLAKGWGKESKAARETTASLEYEASILSLEHSISISIYSTIQAYWQLVSAQKRLAYLIDSSKIQSRVLIIGKALIDSDEIPSFELSRLLGNSKNADASIINAESVLHQARINLAKTTGISIDNENYLPIAIDNFPKAPKKQIIDSLSAINYYNNALSSRPDYKASLLIKDSAKVILVAARSDLKSRADLTFTTGYMGQEQHSNVVKGMKGGFFEDLTGPSFKLALDQSYPISNNEALGNLKKMLSIWNQSSIQTRELKKSIKSNINLVVHSLKDISQQLEQRFEAANSIDATMNSELERYSLGASKLTDIILTEEELTSSRFSFIDIQENYAQYLIKFRFETASLIQFKEGGYFINEENFFKIP